ncbi:hypothetical protein E1211_25925 [Micromonospora sp. 15K316]|uniref:hypothetical protein n=1 Tax=Micromonospora sp. 15K316 TaxID=2530376 RepID=UPI001043A9A6|nr:hypothetical protein [Micromonospora sp. 15K316]TDC29500.1 hypothetical protein E1211_25925 [Micromonospora sp. 15K316]
MVVDRSGSVVSSADVLVEVEWTRVLDDVSTARVFIEPDGDCCERLDGVRSWRHKLVIWRDGHPVWEGPIVDVDWRTTGVEIQAVDVLGWLDRRVPHQDIRFDGRDLADIAAWLIEDGFAPDDPGHDVVVVGATRILGDREYEQDRGQTGDHLRKLAETGVDFTAVGSRILIMPEDHCERVGSLTDADFPAGLSVAEDGASLGTRWVVWGDDDVKGVAGGVDPYYGLLERSVEETSILDDLSAGAAARSRLRGSSPAPVFVDSQQVTLSPDAAVDVPSLVPGWCVDVTTTATCRRVGQSLKIVGVKVTENGSGESVAVQLAPSGV